MNQISNKSRIVLILLSLFFGQLGIDRFYSGRYILGLIKLFTFGGLGIWWIIDFILAIFGAQKDDQGLLI
ncbi:TM2 domain-containing protein [Mycoplasma phocimorsus]|uniref:TM2 domain-containing protein n=2 Tax=Mycoplasma phocimorsus TaxID=3045839 RepID=A0AAJ1UWZ1_9MOLU|nr:TM2 domain-containing protein [Mycoplasma phocimorsus]MDJ1645835.1 TM2 domain-containing protein [Mycoplasma phocimorsus]MDJ1646434.1 TM2 domain-containing protein [Mycoplasma phocimorsus]MDJ1647002.1 TM2 domain-containing protein [Mycoplasma phocimorsus]MDJ1649133.1 TM2 domain-containing protein [Mycoplasma phocimorsus]